MKRFGLIVPVVALGSADAGPTPLGAPENHKSRRREDNDGWLSPLIFRLSTCDAKEPSLRLQSRSDARPRYPAVGHKEPEELR